LTVPEVATTQHFVLTADTGFIPVTAPQVGLTQTHKIGVDKAWIELRSTVVELGFPELMILIVTGIVNDQIDADVDINPRIEVNSEITPRLIVDSEVNPRISVDLEIEELLEFDNA
jgi:hypothetical protein